MFIYKYFVFLVIEYKRLLHLTIFNLSSKQINSKLVELYHVVDFHNQVIELVN